MKKKKFRKSFFPVTTTRQLDNNLPTEIFYQILKIAKFARILILQIISDQRVAKYKNLKIYRLVTRFGFIQKVN